MAKLSELLNELEASIALHDVTKPAVSHASVGWHIEHSLMTFNLVIEQAVGSDPKMFAPKFSWIKLLILTFKIIPRGKGRAPKIVQPVHDISPLSLKQNVDRARQKAGMLLNLHPNSFFVHPFFGHMDLATTRKFLDIHTTHHLKIIRDILK
jgi:hypothetical protein